MAPLWYVKPVANSTVSRSPLALPSAVKLDGVNFKRRFNDFY
jgi:hypothetical protein